MKHAWENVMGLGVAGNFTGHLEQAGEASDFVGVTTAEAKAPKGVFPFYVPAGEAAPEPGHFLHQMPISSSTIRLNRGHENHQIEPEMALLCDLTYAGTQVVDIVPRFAMAHNDCSIRREGARKISEKKNWGADSKGTSTQWIALDRFAPGGVLDRFRLTCFLEREGVLHPYGVDSPVRNYSYIYGQLVEWLKDRLNTQSDHGPLEDLPLWLAAADYPRQALISVGATRYTPFGASHYLAVGDRSIVMLYDETQYYGEAVKTIARNGVATELPGISLLDQQVV